MDRERLQRCACYVKIAFHALEDDSGVELTQMLYELAQLGEVLTDEERKVIRNPFHFSPNDYEILDELLEEYQQRLPLADAREIEHLASRERNGKYSVDDVIRKNQGAFDRHIGANFPSR